LRDVNPVVNRGRAVCQTTERTSDDGIDQAARADACGPVDDFCSGGHRHGPGRRASARRSGSARQRHYACVASEARATRDAAGGHATWKTITTPRLSSDAKWFAYFYGPERWHDGTIVTRSPDSDVEYRFEVGPGSIELQFSDDSRYLAFTTWPLLSAREKSKAREGEIRTGARLVTLATGAAVEYPNVHRFAFSNQASDTFALHRLRADGIQPGPLPDFPRE
jgi:hypothetical protein